MVEPKNPHFLCGDNVLLRKSNVRPRPARMFTVSLISKPGVLSPDWPSNLRNAWGGDDVVWLSSGEAAEFEVQEVPTNFWSVWEDLQTAGIDLCIQKTAGRKKKLLIADMDSTMIGQECIDELAEVAGVGEAVKAVTKRAMNGELNFEESVSARLGLMKGLSADVIAEVLENRITYTRGGDTLLATMKRDGAFCALVSGGFTKFTESVAKTLGFDEHRANVLGIRDGVLTGEVDGPILGRESKVEALEEYCARFGLSEDQVICVGDGANDLGMLGRAGAGVALHAKPAVAAECDLRINHGDLTALLYLQGYSKDELA